MISIWEGIVGNYYYVFDELSHPLQREWLLARSPLPVFIILLTYNIFCTKIGPRLMKNRQPYKLKSTMKLYNVLQVFLSSYIFYEGCIYLFSGNFNFNCQGVDDENKRVPPAIHFYLVTKLIDLLDTVFFVLRKSYRQITFLHLYHHTLMPIVAFIGLKYFPGGQGVIFGAINSFVHIFMYSYYFISGLGPEYQKYLWWKKYLTIMQIVQFVIVFVHSFNSLFYSCSYMNFLKLLTMAFSAVFIFMFTEFYYATYIVGRQRHNVQNIEYRADIRNMNGEKNNGKDAEINNSDNYSQKVNERFNADSINEASDEIFTNGNSNETYHDIVNMKKSKDA